MKKTGSVAPRSLAALALLLAACGKLDGPAAPTGTRLAGSWVSDPIVFDVPGGSPRFVIAFSVDESSVTASDVVWRLVDSDFGNVWPGSAPIANGRFRFEQQYEGSCNDNRYKLTLEVVFRSEAEADGKWSSVALAPPGFRFCGPASGDFKARRR